MIVIPILAQRLLINMRKVDYMGSEPVASNLLFAPPPPGSEDGTEEEFDAVEMRQNPYVLRRRGSVSKASEKDEAGTQIRNV